LQPEFREERATLENQLKLKPFHNQLESGNWADSRAAIFQTQRYALCIGIAGYLTDAATTGLQSSSLFR
jgi:hypothetical protein